MQPLLSICIPTYNRADYLAENITVIAQQLGEHKDSVEFVISDNGSKDNTKETILHLKSSYNLNLTYYFQENPLDFEDNFDFVVDKSHGTYVYLMGDDDIVSPAFIVSLHTPSEHTQANFQLSAIVFVFTVNSPVKFPRLFIAVNVYSPSAVIAYEYVSFIPNDDAIDPGIFAGIVLKLFPLDTLTFML